MKHLSLTLGALGMGYLSLEYDSVLAALACFIFILNAIDLIAPETNHEQ